MPKSKSTKRRRVASRKRLPVGTKSDFGSLLLADRREKGDLIEIEDTTTSEARRARVRTQRMMDRYLLRRQITPRQFDAGERLHELWRRTGAAPLTISNYGLRIVSTGDITDHQAALRADLKEAFAFVGPRLSSLLIHVCICDEPAGDWGERHRGKCADGIAILRLALDCLADFWGMPL